MKRILWASLIALVPLCAASAQTRPVELPNPNTVIARHPAAKQLQRLFPSRPTTLPRDFAATGLTRDDYLKLIAGNVDFWKKHLDDQGGIIDPYEKAERQYATPAFALAAAELVQHAHRRDLIQPATRAFSFALAALVNKTTANQHPDFYIPLLMHAHRILAPRVAPDIAKKWADQLAEIVPDKIYKATGGIGNWNLVNVAGEAMRGKDGFVSALQMIPHMAYLDRSLGKQLEVFTAEGMYADDNVPLAYDAFPRLWLEDMLADGAYAGEHNAALDDALTRGGLSSLLLTSPTGEWANGGRSAQHQWNEAANAAICEINARRWLARGRPDVAASFKRAARLSLASMKRWQRPSGEMWIVKNFAEPEQRLGFEIYSFHSQYNLLPAAMLSIAFERADESIPERPIPSEYGSYLFQVPDFHKVLAVSGGYYALIDSSADLHYDGTGLIRVHRRGVVRSPLSDSAAAERGYDGARADGRAALTPGIQWRNEADGEWIGLADFGVLKKPLAAIPASTQSTTIPATATTATAPSTAPTTAPAPAPPPPPLPPRVVRSAEVNVQSDEGPIELTIFYDTLGQGARDVEEHYVVSSKGVECAQRAATDAGRFVFPTLVYDGANGSGVTFSSSQMRVKCTGGELILTMRKPLGETWSLDGQRLATHNGYVQAAVRELKNPREGVSWHLELKPSP